MYGFYLVSSTSVQRGFHKLMIKTTSVLALGMNNWVPGRKNTLYIIVQS